MNTEEILENANQKLVETAALLDDVELRQHRLIEHLHTLLHHIRQLQSESATWRFRAEEMEKERDQWTRERNLWRSRAEEKNEQLLRVGRTAAELAVQTGSAHCPSCGSSAITLLHGSYPTGVTAPDGGAEAWYECALKCQACGAIEELIESTEGTATP